VDIKSVILLVEKYYTGNSSRQLAWLPVTPTSLDSKQMYRVGQINSFDAELKFITFPPVLNIW